MKASLLSVFMKKRDAVDRRKREEKRKRERCRFIFMECSEPSEESIKSRIFFARRSKIITVTVITTITSPAAS